MKNYLKVKDVAEQLHVSGSTVRHYTNTGQLDYHRTKSGQRYFTQDQVNKYLGVEEKEVIVFYTRSSNGDPTLLKNQAEQLEQKYGTPIKIYSDKASGLRENRPNLERLMTAAKKSEFTTVCVTNKDRLSRFGYTYIEDHLKTLGVKILVLNEKENQTPQDELLQDFMSLIASFSGKFYRLRGYEQQKQLLKKAGETINEKKRPDHQ